MSHWNYRIIRMKTPLPGDPEHYWHGLYEVYYDAAGTPLARTDEPKIVSEDPAGIVTVLEMMLKDAKKNQAPQDIIDDATQQWPGI